MGRRHFATIDLALRENCWLCGLMKFTGKERDAETGLDYFEAR